MMKHPSTLLLLAVAGYSHAHEGHGLPGLSHWHAGDALLLLTDVSGVKNAAGEVVTDLTADQIREMTAAGVIVIDALGSPVLAEALLAAIRQINGLPVGSR